MATSKRKVSFYLMNFRKTIKEIEGIENKAIHKDIKSEELYPCLVEMIEKSFIETKNKTKACKISMSGDDVYIELIEFTKEYSVFKIGHEKATNTYDIINKNTYDSAEVPINDNESLEMYTYCIFDHNNFVCAIIDIYGAPMLASLRTMFSRFFIENYKDDEIFVSYSSILTRDIIKQLTVKEVISNVTAEIAIPQSRILDEFSYVERNHFKNLQNVKTTTVTFNLVSERGKNLFVDDNQLMLMFENAKEKFGDSLKKFCVKARDNDEPMDQYNLLEHRFTRRINLTNDDVNKLSQKDIVSALKNVYTRNLSDINNFIR